MVRVQTRMSYNVFIKMKPSPRIAPLKHWSPYGYFLPAAIGFLLLAVAFRPIEGLIGHDYYHDFSRFYLGALHFWQNGWAVPHYTPSLCGGIPFFADPQSSYYSFPQFFTFFLDPYIGSILTIFAFYAIAYGSCLLLFRNIFHFCIEVSHLGALMFLLNGFAFSHLFVGHLTHHSYLLFPLLIYGMCLEKRRNALALIAQASAFSLALIYMFFSGGMHMMVVFATLLVLLAPWLTFRNYQSGHLKELVIFFALSAGMMGLTCSGKFLASLHYSPIFAVGEIDHSSEGWFPQILRYFWFDPTHTPATVNFGRMTFGPWEYVGFLSKITLIGFLYFAYLRLKTKDRKEWALILAYLILIPSVTAVALGSRVNGSLPFFRHYHNPIKILGAFVPLLIMTTTYGLQKLNDHPYFTKKLSAKKLRQLTFYLCATLLLSESAVYMNFFLKDRVGLAYPHYFEIYDRLKQVNQLPPVATATNAPAGDVLAILSGSSSLRCYEPLFGYRLEKLQSTVKVGDTNVVEAGTFNLNHPGCLIYPEYFHCKPWDKIPESQRADFDLFVHGKVPSWGVPPWQANLLIFNFVMIFLLTVPLFLASFLKKRSHEPSVARRSKVN
jgi:hypothetical protein